MSGILYSSYDVDFELQNRNPNSKNLQEVEELPPFPQNFTSPFFYDNQLFLETMAADPTQQTNSEPFWNQPLPTVNIINMNTAQEISTNTSSTHLHSEPSDHFPKMKRSTFNQGSTGRKSGKKDRHSKINTARGVRDRRMRLSVKIARQFFDLQDTLGFDKASKTIDWLFSQSKKAIQPLYCSPGHISTYQNGSREGHKSEQKRKVNIAASEGEDHVIGLKTDKKSVASGNTKYGAKELRDKARARARERTRLKMMVRCLEKSNSNYLCGEAYNHLPQLGPAYYPNLKGQELMSDSCSQGNIWTPQSSLHCQLANMALLGATASSSSGGSVSCSTFNYGERNGDLFTGEQDFFSSNLCYPGKFGHHF